MAPYDCILFLSSQAHKTLCIISVLITEIMATQSHAQAVKSLNKGAGRRRFVVCFTFQVLNTYKYITVHIGYHNEIGYIMSLTLNIFVFIVQDILSTNWRNWCWCFSKSWSPQARTIWRLIFFPRLPCWMEGMLLSSNVAIQLCIFYNDFGFRKNLIQRNLLTFVFIY